MRVETSRAAVDLAALYTNQWHSLVRTAVFLVDDVESAKDCVQDAFLGLYRASLRDTDAQIAYLRRSVINNARSVLRRRRTVRRHLVRAGSTVTVEPADASVLVVAEHVALLAAVRQLPRRQREVLVLRYWSQLSESEIAAALSMRPGTVKSTASRALKTLESTLGEFR